MRREYMKDIARSMCMKRIRGSQANKERDVVAIEAPVTIFLNDVDLVTLLCSPKDLDYLAIGFLYTEGLIRRREDVKKVFADVNDGAVWVETVKKVASPESIFARRFVTTGCGKGLTLMNLRPSEKNRKSKNDLRIAGCQLTELMREFQGRSDTFRATGGVHSAGLASASGVSAFNEDLGRHNAIDKVIGESIMKGIRTNGRILMTSGRVSSDILIKAARAKLPIIVSRSAPTDMAVRLARTLDITLVGFARGSRMNVYSGERRIVPKRRAGQSGRGHSSR